MTEIRPAASLTSSLLARRGDARPAMRRQPLTHLHVPVQDDLGWNDTGEDNAQPAPQSAEPADASPMARQLDTLAERLVQPAPPPAAAPAAPPALKPARARSRSATARRKPAALAALAGRKAAFTLRIDPERHLRLRLLSALVNRSSQQLLIEALDSLLAAHDKVEDLAGQVETSARAR